MQYSSYEATYIVKDHNMHAEAHYLAMFMYGGFVSLCIASLLLYAIDIH